MEGIKKELLYTPASAASISWMHILHPSPSVYSWLPCNQWVKKGPELWPKTSLFLFMAALLTHWRMLFRDLLLLSLPLNFPLFTGSKRTHSTGYPILKEKQFILIKLNSPYFHLVPLSHFSYPFTPNLLNSIGSFVLSPSLLFVL